MADALWPAGNTTAPAQGLGHCHPVLFPELQPSHFSAEGEPYYDVAAIARSLEVDEEEAREIIRKVTTEDLLKPIQIRSPTAPDLACPLVINIPREAAHEIPCCRKSLQVVQFFIMDGGVSRQSLFFQGGKGEITFTQAHPPSPFPPAPGLLRPPCAPGPLPWIHPDRPPSPG